MRREPLLLAPLLVVTCGCALLVHGPLEEVRVESDPPGATATVSPSASERGPLFLDGTKQYTVTTPGVLRLHRDNSYRIEFSKPGYKIGATKVVSSYDWIWSTAMCSPCEAVGELPTYDLKGKPLPLRFLEAAFYEYPKGFFRAWGRGLRIFSPDPILGTSFKLKPESGGFFSNWHALGTPTISAKLEPTGQ